MLQIIEAHDIIQVEDDPYGCLAFDGDAPLSLLALADGNASLRDRIIYLGSLSKTVAPGLRIGWMAAHPDIIRRAVIAKQTSDLCTPPWIQAAVAMYLEAGSLEAQVCRIVATYRTKRDAMVEELNRQVGDRLKFTVPGGGMFVWGSLEKGRDSAKLLKAAIGEKVLFVPGKAFYKDGNCNRNTLRLSFDSASIEDIRVGVSRLAAAFSK